MTMITNSSSVPPKTTTWIWNLHADAHDFDSHTSDLEDISRKIFSAHFGHLAVIFIWLSGMYFHGAKFSNWGSSRVDLQACKLGTGRRFTTS
jgi:Photosystem I psaA/psaB protein.